VRTRAREADKPTQQPGDPPLTIAKFYKSRWQIELFFRWMKGHLRIKHYSGKRKKP
jgi:IS4 transposase